MTDIKAMKIESQLIEVDDILDNKLSVTLSLNKIPYETLNNQTKSNQLRELEYIT